MKTALKKSLIAALIGSLWLVPLPASTQQTPTVESGEPRVSVLVRHGDTEKVFACAWRKGITVLDVMRLWRADAASIAFDLKSSGNTAFLKTLDGVTNEGGGKDKRNWLVYVNGKLADKGIGATRLQPKDRVAWKFVTWENR